MDRRRALLADSCDKAKYVYKAGWVSFQNATITSGEEYCIFKSNHLKIGTDGNLSSGKLAILKADFTKHKKLYITARATQSASETGFVCVGWDTSKGFYYNNYYDVNHNTRTYAWDIASIVGENYIQLRYHVQGSGGLEIYDIHFE